MSTPTWAVVATVDEPAPLIIAFVAHALSLGPKALHLFLDRPNPEAEAALRGLPNLHMVVCDDAHWEISRNGKRPKLHVWRQRVNTEHVFKRIDADWLVSIDCDEFLRGDLGRDLALQPEAVDFLRIPVAERVLPPDLVQTGLFDGIFRHPMPHFAKFGAEVYGKDAAYYKDGMTGHSVGKSALRVGRDLAVSIHGPLPQLPDRPDYKVTEGRAKHVELLHFDGMTPLHYALKLLRRVAEPPSPGAPRHGAPRIAQFEKMAKIAPKPDTVMAVVDRLKRLRPRQLRALRDAELIDETAFDVADALAVLGLEADLSCARFDQELRARDKDFIAQMGLSI